MTIDAYVAIKGSLHEMTATDFCTISIDEDYVKNDEYSVNEWVRQELENSFHTPVMDEDFEVTNMKEVLDGL